jgi:hypothetical protein
VTRQDQQVAAGAIAEDDTWLDRLQGELHGLLAPVFAQARSRSAAFAYIGALLAEHAWDWTTALAARQRFILARLGDPGAIVVLDETAELNRHTVLSMCAQGARVCRALSSGQALVQIGGAIAAPGGE